MEIYDFLLLTTYVPVIGLCARATIIVFLVHWLPALGAEHGSRLHPLTPPPHVHIHCTTFSPMLTWKTFCDVQPNGERCQRLYTYVQVFGTPVMRHQSFWVRKTVSSSPLSP